MNKKVIAPKTIKQLRSLKPPGEKQPKQVKLPASIRKLLFQKGFMTKHQAEGVSGVEWPNPKKHKRKKGPTDVTIAPERFKGIL